MRRLGAEFEEPYNDYFCWLCELVCVDGRYTDQSYFSLANRLWETDFIWFEKMDEDRLKDGLELRRQYAAIGGEDHFDGPCTLLEVLVAIAQRMDNILTEMDGESKIPIFFWEMIDNLGLSNFSDFEFETSSRPNSLHGRIDRKIDAWMHRDIEYDGTGGLFPLQSPKQDQKYVDIWYQMNAYMIENYMI